MRLDDLIIILLAILTSCSIAIAVLVMLAIYLTRSIEAWRDRKKLRSARNV